MYDSAQKKRWDDYAVKEYAISEALKKNNTEIAEKLTKQGLPAVQISGITGLSIEEIEKINNVK